MVLESRDRLKTRRRCRRYLRLMDRTPRVWSHRPEEQNMKPLERLTQRLRGRTGLIAFAATIGLTLSSTSVGRGGAMLVAAEKDGTAIRPFRVTVHDAELA